MQQVKRDINWSDVLAEVDKVTDGLVSKALKTRWVNSIRTELTRKFGKPTEEQWAKAFAYLLVCAGIFSILSKQNLPEFAVAINHGITFARKNSLGGVNSMADAGTKILNTIIEERGRL